MASGSVRREWAVRLSLALPALLIVVAAACVSAVPDPIDTPTTDSAVVPDAAPIVPDLPGADKDVIKAEVQPPGDKASTPLDDDAAAEYVLLGDDGIPMVDDNGSFYPMFLEGNHTDGLGNPIVRWQVDGQGYLILDGQGHPIEAFQVDGNGNPVLDGQGNPIAAPVAPPALALADEGPALTFAAFCAGSPGHPKCGGDPEASLIADRATFEQFCSDKPQDVKCQGLFETQPSSPDPGLLAAQPPTPDPAEAVRRDYCIQNPLDPICGFGEGLDPDEVQAAREDFCRKNPTDPKCGFGAMPDRDDSEAERDAFKEEYCRQNPQVAGCEGVNDETDGDGKDLATPTPRPPGSTPPTPTPRPPGSTPPTPTPFGVFQPVPVPTPTPFGVFQPVPTPTPTPVGIFQPLPPPTPTPFGVFQPVPTPTPTPVGVFQVAPPTPTPAPPIGSPTAPPFGVDVLPPPTPLPTLPPGSAAIPPTPTPTPVPVVGIAPTPGNTPTPVPPQYGWELGAIVNTDSEGSSPYDVGTASGLIGDVNRAECPSGYMVVGVQLDRDLNATFVGRVTGITVACSLIDVGTPTTNISTVGVVFAQSGVSAPPYSPTHTAPTDYIGVGILASVRRPPDPPRLKSFLLGFQQVIVSPDRLEVDVTSVLIERSGLSGTSAGVSGNTEINDCGVPDYGQALSGRTSVRVLTGLGTFWYSAIGVGFTSVERIGGLRLFCQTVNRVELPPGS